MLFENSKHSALIGSFASFQRPAEDILYEAAECGNDLYLIFQKQTFYQETSRQKHSDMWHRLYKI